MVWDKILIGYIIFSYAVMLSFTVQQFYNKRKEDIKPFLLFYGLGLIIAPLVIPIAIYKLIKGD